MQAYSAPSNMSLSNILIKTKNFLTWNQKCLICVILGFKFEKLVHYCKSAPTNQPKCKVLRKSSETKNCPFLDIFRLKSLKNILIFGISNLKVAKKQVVQQKEFQFQNQKCLICVILCCKFKKVSCKKTKILKFKTKDFLLNNFRLKFGKKRF